MDLIVDAHNHAILTIVERSTNMLFMTKLPHGKKSEPLAKAVRRLLLPYKKYIKTITTDNGPEFAAHKLITKYLGAVVYFADPYASWQKGAIENTNKLIRQYIPKQANFDDFTDTIRHNLCRFLVNVYFYPTFPAATVVSDWK